MRIWAIADLHLAISQPSKNMIFFGPEWEEYMEKIEKNWKEVVHPEDLVLIAGDICWAMQLQEAIMDLQWIDQLPGTKVIIRGNHDYWWSSAKKMSSVLPSSIFFIHNTAFHWHDVAIGGSRLWDTTEYSFGKWVRFQENSRETPRIKDPSHEALIFERELGRLQLSLQQMNPKSLIKIVMTHYPPIGADLQRSRTSNLLEKFGVNIAIFGHLHNLKERTAFFGEARGIKYYLVAADFLKFRPLRLVGQEASST